MPVTTGAELPTSAVVFGLGAAGKSTHIANLIKTQHAGKKVLWLSLDNTAVFEDDPALVDAFDIGVYKDWSAFKKDADNAIKTAAYDVIVVDGLAALHRLAMAATAKGDQPSLPEWGKMSKDVHTLIRSLKDACTHFYATALLKIDNVAPTGAAPNYVTGFDLNADAARRLLPEFNRKVYVFVGPKLDDKGVVIGQLHIAQHDSAAALRFSQAQYV